MSAVTVSRGRVICLCRSRIVVFFFFQAEDGIRDYKVTGVQTCALPIYQDRQQGTHRDPRDSPRQAAAPPGGLGGGPADLGAALVTKPGRPGQLGAARVTVHGSGNLTGTMGRGSA